MENKFWETAPLRTSRRGHCWITGERIQQDGKTYQRFPMYVEWEAPEKVTQPYPVVLIHGGRLQGTEWKDTPDGRPGWAQRFIEAGYAVFMPDRPGHGRSPVQPAVTGPTGTPFSYEEGEHVYYSPEDAAVQTQWPFDLHDAAAVDAFIAPFGPLPTDMAGSQDADATRLAQLLDKIGPAILVTHSASGPGGWLTADRRREKVVAIVSIEPMGPPYADIPGFGKLSYGLTATPISGAIKDLPIAIVTGEAAIFATYGPAIVKFLKEAGAAAEQINLPDYGVRGNGHGLIFERNSDEALQPVLAWLAKL